MWETSALVELLERKGILTKQEVLDMTQERHRREPSAIPPRRLSREAITAPVASARVPTGRASLL